MDLGCSLGRECSFLRSAHSRKNEMEQSQFRLKRVRAEGSGSVVPQNDKVVFSRHACENGGLVQHGFHIQGRRTRVFKGFTWFEDWLAARDSGAGYNVLMRKPHRLNFESTRDQLNRVVG